MSVFVLSSVVNKCRAVSVVRKASAICTDQSRVTYWPKSLLFCSCLFPLRRYRFGSNEVSHE